MIPISQTGSSRLLSTGRHFSIAPLIYFSILLACIDQNTLESAEDSFVENTDYSSELKRTPPLEPDQALASFELVEGYQIELMAAEPLVADPVAMAFDEDGRLFVVEMRGYSEQDDQNLGQVRLLEDTDQDGRFDKSEIFADDLSWPTAIACSQDGVYVGVAPHILFLRDNDGDGKSDHKEIVFTGFGKDNVQGLLNSFQWGLDNRIHGSTSSVGGNVFRPDHPEQKPLSLKGRDFAFDPQSRNLLATSGGGQHGMSFDRWGDKFVCANSDHLQMIVAEERYLARNPYQPSGSPLRSIAADGPQAEVYRTSAVEPWRIVRTRLRAEGIVPGTLEGGGRASGYFTSATGITVYEGDAWPESDRGLIFVADVGSNLVHRKRLLHDGPIYSAVRIDEGRELLTSSDIWFRPVQMCNGPDGALYIADMYREVIEHPKSLPESIKQHLDLTNGRQKGRIYRVVSAGFKQPKVPRLSQASTDSLVAMLDSRNAWQRRTAARLLYERQDRSAIPPLRRLSEIATLPEGRIAALHALAGLDQLFEAEVKQALDADHPEIQRHAILLGELLANESSNIRQAFYRLVNSKEPRVAHQLAFSLGELEDSRRFAVLADLAAKNSNQPFVLEAIGSSLHEGAGQVLANLYKRKSFAESAAGRQFTASLLRQIANQQSSKDLSILSTLLHRYIGKDPTKFNFLCNHLEVPRDSQMLMRLFEQTPEITHHQIDSALRVAQAVAVDTSQPEWQRIESIGILRWLPWEHFEALSDELLVPNESMAVQLAVLNAMGHIKENEVALFLFERWRSLTFDLREKAFSLFYSRPSWSSMLLQTIDDGKLTVNDLGAGGIALLASHPDKRVRERTAQLQSGLQQYTRKDILTAYLPALRTPGDAEEGAKVFQKSCSTCHQHNGIGFPLGPNLSTAQSQGAETLLMNILAPNKEVNPRYMSYIILTNDGVAHAGMVKSETATTVTLQRSHEETISILRSNIESMSSTGLSLMPEELHRDIDLTAMANLFAFLRSTE